ncbi:hypothetical protein LMG23992_03003 [Cupriavidus laharis]|uniref:Molecular chaperone DnaJ n=1 Tax=Cupriavidus laharis TaxID=151654 RepID=A0ABN7YU37_9BURK|nr:J domain-containing protein [Cupriavidus laharis]CAG9175616.1 hypothetical protein LMG23992_03003 [Cupriavidus laharis]
MARPNPTPVIIAPGHNKPTLSKGQKTFNRLIKQIEERRARLSAWEAVTHEYHQKYVSKLLPLEETCKSLRTRMVQLLDRTYAEKAITKTERRKLDRIIAELAGELVGEDEDAEMKAIYNRHSQSDYDGEVAAETREMKAMLEEILEVNLGDDLDMFSPDDLMQRTQAHLEQLVADAEAEDQAQQDRRARRRKSARQVAAEARAQEEEEQISLSIREVYRKLASALHPDRETDPLERERKTALMQRVNQAYARRNLLELLELQLELEHIDQHSINSISEDRLKHYNKILKEQLAELDQEILFVEARFADSYDILSFVALSPNTVMRDLDDDIAELKLAVDQLESDLVLFKDIKQVKAWLKTIKARPTRPSFDDFDEIPF